MYSNIPEHRILALAAGVTYWFDTGAVVGPVAWQIFREIVYTFFLLLALVFFVAVRSQPSWLRWATI